MPCNNRPVDRNTGTRTDKDCVASDDLSDINVPPFVTSADSCSVRQEINKPLNRLAASTDRQTLEYFCHKDEKGDYECGENFANRKRGNDRDGHGEFHRHTALYDVLVGFVEDREATSKCTNHAERSDVRIATAIQKPDPRRSQGD